MILPKSRHSRQTLLIVLCFVLLVAACVLAVVRYRAFQLVVDIPENTINTTKPGLPLRLKIPKLSVDAAIDYVGLTPEGDLDVPRGYDSGGWYKDGPHPGEPGSAVIDGHFGRADGKAAIFDDLHTLQKGDKINVTDVKGATTTFTVTGLRTYNPGEDATAVFRSDDGVARLNLITCQGGWDNSQNSYAARLVVFSEKE